MIIRIGKLKIIQKKKQHKKILKEYNKKCLLDNYIEIGIETQQDLEIITIKFIFDEIPNEIISIFGET